MIRYCKWLLLLITACLTHTAGAQVDVIVRLQEGAGLNTAMQGGPSTLAAARPGLADGVSAVQPLFSARSATHPLPDWTLRVYRLTVPDSALAQQVLARWSAAPEVAYAQYNHRYRLDAFAPSAAPDPHLDSLDHFAVIRVPEAWAVTDGRPEVRIGLVDTGVFLDHPDLASQLWIHPGEDLNGNGRFDPEDLNGIDDDGNGYVDDLRGYDFVDRTAAVEPGDYTDPDPDPSDDPAPGGGRGHGTIVAGVLAAARDNGVGGAGVAPGCRIVPLRAFGADGLAEDDDVAAAIVYAAQLGLDVLNLSFGDVYYSPLMHESIRYAVAQGTVVVASAGNVGGDRPHYPSDYPEIISTAWLNAEGTGIAGRGTYGVGIDLGAPGTAVYTTLLPPAEAPASLYGRRSGSSMAAPMVAAAAALLKTIQPDLSPASVRSILTGTAADLDLPGWDHRTAAGRLDVAAAVQRVLPGRTELLAPAHEAGVSGGVVAIVGTALDAGFRSAQVFIAPEVPGEEPVWEPLGEMLERQVLADTLAFWNTDDYAEGTYLLRLSTRLRSGRAVEARHRVFLDRTPPQVEVHLLDAGLIADAYGLVADVAVDDLASLRMEVTLGGQTYTAASDRRSRRLGAYWVDPTRRGGTARVRLVVTSAAGLTTDLEREVFIPPAAFHAGWMTRTPLDVPHGFLLPRATDFDRDGLLELTLNRYQDGWIGDTLATYEWDGSRFRPAQRLVANVIPRDAGDSDGDGLLELLTQVVGATLLLEQPDPSAFPWREAFLDTTGLADPFNERSAFGARLTDLDQDGRGEVLVHNTRAWRVLEYDGTSYVEVARLDNPTGVGTGEIDRNEFQEPEALIGDPDGDGRLNLLVGDSDGDWILYEASGDDAYAVVWTHETDRYNAGSRLAAGDFDGDGFPEFVTYTQAWTQPTREGVLEPQVGRYYVWDAIGDDALVPVDSLTVWGHVSRHGSLTTADFDGDGRDELVLAHPPALYVFSWEDGWRRRDRYAYTADPGIRSMAMVAADWDGTGVPHLIVAGADERLHRFAMAAGASAHPPPQWVAAHALDARRVFLTWTPGPDSVTVFRGQDGGPLDPVATVSGNDFIDSTDVLSRYVLRGWKGGAASALSPVRYVRPHAPAVVLDVDVLQPASVRLRFSEALPPTIAPERFRFDRGIVPDAVLSARQGREVILRFTDPLTVSDTLRWDGLTDREGTPVGQAAVFVEVPDAPDRGLHLLAWDVLGLDRVRLRFSEALDPAVAENPAHYRIIPAGTVAAVRFDPSRPDEVEVQVAGQAIGPTGRETALVVTYMRGASGSLLAAEGQTASLVAPADDLDQVYLYPNPVDVRRHDARVMVAGLPAEALVQVLSAQGVLVRRLTESDGNGGLWWDLRDEAGQAVPSGIYLVRVEAPDGSAVLQKVAVIR
ncbi:hypothetical protein AWN76_003390 [Rhodothermaceae bacterium RA]|nr:hypothetical protein AWN76_003390 [Rhodothermaceae bacterium RA]